MRITIWHWRYCQQLLKVKDSRYWSSRTSAWSQSNTCQDSFSHSTSLSLHQQLSSLATSIQSLPCPLTKFMAISRRRHFRFIKSSKASLLLVARVFSIGSLLPKMSYSVMQITTISTAQSFSQSKLRVMVPIWVFCRWKTILSCSIYLMNYTPRHCSDLKRSQLAVLSASIRLNKWMIRRFSEIVGMLSARTALKITLSTRYKTVRSKNLSVLRLMSLLGSLALAISLNPIWRVLALNRLS